VHVFDDAGEWSGAFDNTVAPMTENQVVVTWRDVTRDERGRRDLERTRSQAEHAATHDHLTGLPNRALLRRRLQEAIDAASEDRRVAVVFCDLDGFKSVNDTYGHTAGDLVLQEVAKRLTHLTRASDTAARLAGDEFVLVLRDLPANWRPDAFRERADRLLRRPVDLGGNGHGAAHVRTSASLGFVLVGGGRAASTPETILEEADRAMYRVKHSRGGHRAPAGGGSAR
jgi:diguanylate cyclase (GGDEF)-like protein